MEPNEYSIPEKEEDMEIDLKDCFYAILKKWKSIVILGCIGLLLGFGYAYISKLNENVIPDYEPTEPGMENDMTRIMELDTAYRLYQDALKDEKNDYRSTLKEDQTYYTGTVSYSFSAETDGDAMAAANLFNIPANNDIMKKIADVLQFEGDLSTLGNVLSISDTYLDPNYLNSKDGMVLHDFTYPINVSLVTEEQFEQVIDIIDREIMNLRDQNAEQFSGNVKISRLSVTKRPYTNNIVLTQLNAMKAETNKLLLDYNTLIEDTKKNASRYEDAEKLIKYYQINYQHAEEEEESTEGFSIKSGIKMAIIFAVVLAILCAGVYFILYLADGRIHTLSDITDYYRLPLAGYLYQEKKRDTFTKKLLSGYTKSKQTDSTTIEYIQNILHQDEQTNSCVCGVGILRNKLFIEELKNAIDKPLFETNFYKNTEALKAATACGAIYLMLELNETTKRELENALNVCRQQNIGVKGVIATEQT